MKSASQCMGVAFTINPYILQCCMFFVRFRPLLIHLARPMNGVILPRRCCEKMKADGN